jgi:uncharacterized protein YraI
MHIRRPLFALAFVGLLLFGTTVAWLQSPPVTAEAYIEANLRAYTDVAAEQVGQITGGTAYPVIGRSEFYPWLLLGDPATREPIGWVFRELVVVNGNLLDVPVRDEVVNPAAPPTPTLAATPTLNAVASPSDSDEPPLVGVALGALVTATPQPTVALTGITGTLSGEVNIRYGPGVNYPRIGVGRAGDVYEVTAYHTSVPWVQIRYDAVAGGFGWLALDLIDIDGNIFTLPSTSQTNFDLPTLTPTPDAVTAAGDFGSEPSPAFKALGDSLWDKVLAAGFEPETSRLGSLFLMDLTTGETIAFGDDIAYSGMSLSKINILTTMYAKMDSFPDGEEARHLASMMVCSENTSSNQILSYIGGDPYRGAAEVTAYLRSLELTDTFMVAPFLIDPRITPQPVAAPQSPADQTRANPDPFNQMTVTEMGQVLHGIYQCAADGTGLLMDTGDFTQAECQQMLYLMRGNRIGALIEVGVPDTVGVAHKHGWIDDTHGDAGIVFTSGGDYVLVVVLHGPVWLNFEESFPLIEDISLTVYNYFNPDAPMLAARQSNVPEVCELSNADGLRLIDNLTRGRSE